MEIELYLYEKQKEGHIFYFQTHETLTLLKQLNIEDISILELFFELSEGSNYRWFEKSDINVTCYNDLILIIRSIKDLFISKLQIKSNNFLVTVHDNFEVTLTVSDLSFVVPKIINNNIFELLMKNEGKYMTISDDKKVNVYDNFDVYIDSTLAPKSSQKE